MARSRGLLWGFSEPSDDTTSTHKVTHSGAPPSHTENKEIDWHKMQYLYSPALSARSKIPYGPQLLLQITLQIISIYLPTNYELQGFSTATITCHFVTVFFFWFFRPYMCSVFSRLDFPAFCWISVRPHAAISHHLVFSNKHLFLHRIINWTTWLHTCIHHDNFTIDWSLRLNVLFSTNSRYTI